MYTYDHAGRLEVMRAIMSANILLVEEDTEKKDSKRNREVSLKYSPHATTRKMY